MVFGRPAVTGLRSGARCPVLLLLASGLSILVPLPIIRVTAQATPYRASEGGFHLFQGEHAMWAFVIFHGFWITLASFFVLVICIFSVGRTKAQQGACT